MTTRLLRRYQRGTRHALDVTAYLDYLVGNGKFSDASLVFAQAVALVRPVPRLLWHWGTANIELLEGHACKRVIDGKLNGVCREDVHIHAARSGDFLLALLACLVERVAMNEVDACLAFARPFIDAAVRHRADGFHYDSLALDTLDAWEGFLARPTTLDAWDSSDAMDIDVPGEPPRWMRDVLVQALRVRCSARDPNAALHELYALVSAHMTANEE